MAVVGPAPQSFVDPDVIVRLEAEVKRLAEQDQKCQAELDELVKAKKAVDQEHQYRLAADRQEVDELKVEVDRLWVVEAEQHKTETSVRLQLGGFAMALKGRLASPVWLPFFTGLLLSDLSCLTAGFYLAVVDEAKKTHIASLGVAPNEPAMSGC